MTRLPQPASGLRVRDPLQLAPVDRFAAVDVGPKLDVPKLLAPVHPATLIYPSQILSHPV